MKLLRRRLSIEIASRLLFNLSLGDNFSGSVSSVMTVSLFPGLSGLSVPAFLGAGAATVVVCAAGSWRRRGTASLLLAGIAVSFLFSSLTLIVQYTGNYVDTFRMAR